MEKIVIKDIIGVRATDMKQGNKIYDLIVRGFQSENSVCVDFKGMTTILSIFLNNSIGALYKDYTSEYLNANLELLHLSEYDRFILQQVTTRAKDFYKNTVIITKALDEKFSDEGE